MSRHVLLPSLGWFVLSCSVACMGASFALAQRAAERDNGAQAEDQPAPPRPSDRGDDPATERAQQPGRNASRERDREAIPRDEAGQPRQPLEREGDPRDERQRSGELGIRFEGEEDLVVGEVAPGSRAAQAGFRPQDRIISVNGRQLTGQRRFAAFLGSLAGRRVPVVIERNGRQYTVQLMPGENAGDGPWLGVYLQDNEGEQQGAVITHIYPAGPAARAGLRPGDVILAANDQKIASTPDLIATLDRFQPRDKVKLQIMRGEQEMEVNAVLARRNDFFYQASYEGGRDGDRERGEFEVDDDDPFSNIPPHAMQLEHDRRMAEQHERIENELRKLQEEVKQLREAIERK